jgi:DNA-binding protein HU-beta
VATKDTLGKIKDAAVETIVETVKDPVGAGHKALGTGKAAVNQAVGTALTTAAAVSDKVRGRTGSSAPKSEPRPTPVAVPDEGPAKVEGDPLSTKPAKATAATKKTTAKKSTTKKSTAKKAPAKKATAKKAATKSPTKKTTVTADLPQPAQEPSGGSEPTTGPDQG